MKKSCQHCNSLFCKEDDVMCCTATGANRFCCTKMERYFGAVGFA
ncbi:reductase [Lelliottia nimipressuralis]|uniref:Reductase n=1 Tax=Lelliottia nimipressuralis TaxID=69220 RepID=A0ABY3NXF8_9ENTR|nr:reductase [Lelliottia nimipressuralis]